MKIPLVHSLTRQYHGTEMCTQRIPVGDRITFNLAYFSDYHYLTFGLSEAKQGAALPDHIYMDAMGFGMGCSCLQLTFQSCNVSDARRMYDGLIPIGPILVRAINWSSLLNISDDQSLAGTYGCQPNLARIPG